MLVEPFIGLIWHYLSFKRIPMTFSAPFLCHTRPQWRISVRNHGSIRRRNLLILLRVFVHPPVSDIWPVLFMSTSFSMFHRLGKTRLRLSLRRFLTGILCRERVQWNDSIDQRKTMVNDHKHRRPIDFFMNPSDLSMISRSRRRTRHIGRMFIILNWPRWKFFIPDECPNILSPLIPIFRSNVPIRPRSIISLKSRWHPPTNGSTTESNNWHVIIFLLSNNFVTLVRILMCPPITACISIERKQQHLCPISLEHVFNHRCPLWNKLIVRKIELRIECVALVAISSSFLTHRDDVKQRRRNAFIRPLQSDVIMSERERCISHREDIYIYSSPWETDLTNASFYDGEFRS